MSKRLPGFENVRPPKPTMRDVRVALAIAQRIMRTILPTDTYWSAEQKEDRVCELAASIVVGGSRVAIFRRLPDAWKWDRVDDQAKEVFHSIAREVLAEAIKQWREKYA